MVSIECSGMLTLLDVAREKGKQSSHGPPCSVLILIPFSSSSHWPLTVLSRAGNANDPGVIPSNPSGKHLGLGKSEHLPHQRFILNETEEAVLINLHVDWVDRRYNGRSPPSQLREKLHIMPHYHIGLFDLVAAVWLLSARRPSRTPQTSPLLTSVG